METRLRIYDCDGITHPRHDAWNCETRAQVVPLRRDGTPRRGARPAHIFGSRWAPLHDLQPTRDSLAAINVSDPTGEGFASEWRPAPGEVRAALPLAIAEAPDPVRVGLLVEKYRDGRHRVQNWPKRVNDHFVTAFSTDELLELAGSARKWVDDWLTRRFECGASWHVRDLPRIPTSSS